MSNLFGQEARDTNLRGAKILYQAVKAGYGPMSGNVGILRKHALPKVTHDGVTIAKNLKVKGDERFGADLLKQSAVNMDDRLGDGTTTVTILAYHILEEAYARGTLGENRMVLKRKLIKDLETVLERLPELSQKADTQDKLRQIATISAGDEKIGEMVAKIIHEVGDGSVTVQEGQSLDDYSQTIEGYAFDRGFISPYMIEDPSRIETVLTEPVIHVTDQKLTKNEHLTPILEKLKGGKQLLIIADDVQGEALKSLINARERFKLNIVAVKAPGYAEHRGELLKDITVLTEGGASKVIVNEDKTTIIGAKGDIKERIKQLKTAIKSQDSEYRKQQIKDRISSLQGKVAIISVGGSSEAEVGERKDRFDDAVYATKASLDGGTVVGGGVTYHLLSECLEEGSILKNALQQPFKILLENSGLEEVELKATKILDEHIGVDVITGKSVNLRESGILDPTKLVREAITTAVSVAGESMILDVLEIEDEDE